MFDPVVIGQGLSGWTLLQTTLHTQKDAFNRSSNIKSDVEYLKTELEKVSHATELVEDRRLLRIVLDAYDLSDDLDSRFFIKTVMEGGIDDRSSLANKLSDRRYRQLAADFDFSRPTSPISGELVAKTVKRFQTKSFEVAVGEQDRDMRLALGFQNELRDITRSAPTNTTAWYQILATPSIRTVIDKALSLPKEFQNLDIDVQLERIKDRASQQFGTDEVSAFASDDLVDKIVQRFLVRQQAAYLSSSNSMQTALTLLRQVY